jgi:hypothetical protein
MFVALSDATLGREVIFGKNSDRPKGEIQDIVVFPAQNYSSRAVVQCSYLSKLLLKSSSAVFLPSNPPSQTNLCGRSFQTAMDVGCGNGGK